MVEILRNRTLLVLAHIKKTKKSLGTKKLLEFAKFFCLFFE